MALAHTRMKVLGRSGGNTVGRIAYRSGVDLVCEDTGECFKYKGKNVQHVELLLPKDAPSWALELQNHIAQNRQSGIQAFVNLAESYEQRIDSQVYREYEFALPRELSAEQGIELARDFVQDQMCTLGMTALLNFHLDVDNDTQEPKYHCHAVMLTRRLTKDGLSPLKERAWNDRALGQEWRGHFAAYTNFHLAKHGHTVRIDPRSYAEQGIDLEAQAKLGPGTLKKEHARGAHPKDVNSQTVTDKGQEYQRIKLRNLHQILSDPGQILKVVSAHHVTFMWGDVEATLRRYIDDPGIFKNISARLKTSPELVLLGELEKDGDKVYTTRTLLACEVSLTQNAVSLRACASHPVAEKLQRQAIETLNERFFEGGGLSLDQKEALLHMLAPQQAATVVGYAGSGKTTLLQAARHAWQQAGYQVYGLAPTGIAAQNLKGAGINSQVLHKFLWQYDRGRCQYTSKTVLVLDEAGMVDVPHFDRILQAVQSLGIKLVMVGDARQLQAVASGDAFRLVTERIPPGTLKTVLRQEKEWQQQATQLFGKGQSIDALSLYLEKGAFTFVEETLVPLEKLPYLPPQELLLAYAQAKRVASTVYQSIVKQGAYAGHEDAPLHHSWKARRLLCAKSIFERLEACRPFMAPLGFDGQSFGRDLLTLAKETVTEEALEKRMAQLHLPQTSQSPMCEIRSCAKEKLVEAWAQSLKAHPQDSHLLLTYTHKDSQDLNTQARAFMKSEGLLQGVDHLLTLHKDTHDAFGARTTLKEQRAFAVGDRLLFLKNQDTIKNGMLGTILDIQKEAITLKLDGQDAPFVFNPQVYKHFEYGYAPTIHKSQGITVDRTFVLATHQMFENLGYVALTRHRKDVKIFGSRLDFWWDEIVTVMATKHHKLSSFDYVSEDTAHALLKENESILEKSLRRLGERAYGLMAVTKESWHRMTESFLGRSPRLVYGALPLALTESSRGQLLQHSLLQERSAQEKTGSTLSQRSPLLNYYRAEDVQNTLSPAHIETLFKGHIGAWIERPTLHKQGNTVRFGRSRGFAVDTHKGLWYNHYDGRKGNLFNYIADSKNISYGEAVAWVGRWAGAPTSLYEGRANPSSLLQHQRALKDHHDTERLRQACHKAQRVFDQSTPLSGTPAQKYLQEHRALSQTDVPDLRFHASLFTEGKTYPALMAFARNPEGQITAYQAIYLDAQTNRKAQNLGASKKTHGVLKGSAVTLQQDREGKGITYIAEGLETALSLKEAGLKGEILASLGQSSMGALTPKGKTLVLVGDYDASNHPRTQGNLAKIAQLYEGKGHIVHTLYPTTTGPQKLDFNDLLQHKGPQSIKEIFKDIEGTISKHAPSQQMPESVSVPKNNEGFLKTLEQFKTSQDTFKRKLFFKDMAYALKEMAAQNLYHLETQTPFRDTLSAGLLEYKDHPPLKGSCERIQTTLHHMDLFQKEGQKTNPTSQEILKQEGPVWQEKEIQSHKSVDPLKRVEHLLTKLDATSDRFKQKLIHKDLERAFLSLDSKTLNALDSNQGLKDKIEKHASHLTYKSTIVMD